MAAVVRGAWRAGRFRRRVLLPKVGHEVTLPVLDVARCMFGKLRQPVTTGTDECRQTGRGIRISDAPIPVAPSESGNLRSAADHTWAHSGRLHLVFRSPRQRDDRSRLQVVEQLGDGSQQMRFRIFFRTVARGLQPGHGPSQT